MTNFALTPFPTLWLQYERMIIFVSLLTSFEGSFIFEAAAPLQILTRG